MTQVRDKAQATRPGAISRIQWGPAGAGRRWVIEHSSMSESLEGSTGHAAVSEFSYTAVTGADRWRRHRSETGIVVSDEVTGIFGFGADLNSAIADVAKALVEHRDVLERQDALSPDLEEQLSYLRDLF